MLTLRRLSYWFTLSTLSAACATYQPASDGKAGKSSSSEAGAPDSGSNTGATGGSTAGSTSTGGTTAGTDSTGGGTGGSATAGTSTGGSTPVGGEPAMAGADTGGAPAGGEDAGGAGGTPDPGCTGAADCDDKNPCTDDSCVDTVCQHANNTQPCADDADDCTDDVCAAGACTHPANTAPCEDDGDNCTNDVCAGDFCTHPSNGTCTCQTAAQCNDSNPCTTDKCVGNQCQNLANSLGCTDDNNPCTDDVCVDKVCTHNNNTSSCADDGDACSNDVCAAGVCTHPHIDKCCSGDGDCFDGNVCTTDTCSNGVCTNPNNTGPCAADGSPCTSEVCGVVSPATVASCTHPSNAVCAGSDDIIILANRNGDYIVLNGTNLEYTGTSAGTAEVFEKVGEVGTKFKLRSKSNGMYVTLGAGDVLTATADQAGGMLFDAPACGATPPWVGLNATTDVNGGAWVAADTANQLISRSGDCGPASDTSWEKFQLISVTIPCKQASDCDDGNVCTDETCGGNGFCVYTDHAGTCADDSNACTDDVCNTGTCTHPGNGTCPGPLVTIQANRNSYYVVLNGTTSYLEYTAATVGAAGSFEQVDKVGTQYKIRASNSMFVTLDAADNLIANADFAGAMLFDTPACDSINVPGVDVALVATGDDDAQKYVAADTASRLIARSGACNAASATAYEKFVIQ